MTPRDSEGGTLGSGSTCLKHGCVECCLETEMPLTRSDMRRIVGEGFRLSDFAVKVMAEWRLRNVSGRCFFLSDGLCRIYTKRPEGCRLYPLIFNVDTGEPVLDDLCPYRGEFRVDKGDTSKLIKLIRRLEREAGEERKNPLKPAG
jgi:Fe-S-cluster containining protein